MTEKWKACYLVNEDNAPMTPEELGALLVESIKLTKTVTGERPFLAVLMEMPDGKKQSICLVGCGPQGPQNARLIEAAPGMLNALEETLAFWDSTGFSECAEDCHCVVQVVQTAIANATKKN